MAEWQAVVPELLLVGLRAKYSGVTLESLLKVNERAHLSGGLVSDMYSYLFFQNFYIC